MGSSHPSYTVVIGSSAGGLEALTAFLNHLPNIEDLAVVVAQHLSPTYKSHLVELLARETLWPVVEIVSGLPLQAGYVYITPPDADAILKAGCFELLPPASAIGPKPSANVLFASLAAQAGTLPIGVILSGTGNDGAESLSLLKEAGGWCLAHTPEHARYQGMPQAAINTGCVDYVLAPAEMGTKIAALIADPEMITREANNVLESDSDAYAQIIALLTAHTGTNFLNYKPTTIRRRLQKRLDYLSHPSYEDYLESLHQNPSELDLLFKTMLIGVTRFFRDPEVFEALNTYLLKLLQQNSDEQSVRVWVPGCASGEEVYTIAILIQELLSQQALPLEVQIFATDISEVSLSIARQGIYPEESLQGLPETWRQSYFQELPNGEYQVMQRIRDSILFSRHDLTANPPFFKLDFISCRNLLIYFDAHLQRHILPIFHFSLKPDGLLLLGKSETIGSFGKLFAPLNGPLKIFRRRSALSSSASMSFHTFKPLTSPRQPLTPLSTKKEDALKARLKASIFENYPYPYVVVNTSLELLQIHGDVSAYLSLSAGRVSTHLLKLCHDDLQMELRSLSNQSIQENRRVTGVFRRWPDARGNLLLRLIFHPVHSDSGYDEGLVVTFETLDLVTESIPVLSQNHTDQADSYQPDGPQDGGRIQELEQELKLTRQYLQSTVEELEASNEELQVINEELQSANEELQSSNEELETTNEELQSMNEEMQVAYAELRTANEILERKDLILKQSQANTQAILENSSQGVLLIAPNYHVMAFNTLAYQQQQIHFNTDLKEGLLLMDAFDSETLSHLLPLIQQTLKQQVKTQQDFYFETAAVGYWYNYSFLPVLKEGEVIGLTLSMQDVTEKVLAHQELEKSNALIDSVFDATSTGICVTNDAGVFIKVNQGYCDIYGYSAQELLGQHFTMVMVPEQRQMASESQEIFIVGSGEMPREWKMQAKDGHFIDVLVSARLLVNPDGSHYKVTTVYDISESKKYRDLLSDTQKAVGVAGWELDVIHNVIYWTPEVYSIYGIPLDTPIDFELAYGRYPEEDRARLELAMQKAISAGVPFDLEFQFYRSDDQLVWVRTTCKPIRVYNKTVKLFGTFQDITERKLAEEDKSQLIYELTYKNEDLNQFTYIISHNLRAPVANLLGLVNLLELRAAEEKDVLKHIKSAATQLDEVIQDLNQILSVRRQDQQDFYQQVNLEIEMRALMVSLEPELKDLNAEVTFDFQQPQLFTIRSYLHSILYNLLTNAIKYASEQQALKIEVRSWQENEFTYLSVRDNGRGFNPEKVLGQMFRLYKRFHPHIPGKGMGLYLVKTQAEALGGGVSVVSQENQGACFTVYVKSSPV